VTRVVVGSFGAEGLPVATEADRARAVPRVERPTWGGEVGIWRKSQAAGVVGGAEDEVAGELHRNRLGWVVPSREVGLRECGKLAASHPTRPDCVLDAEAVDIQQVAADRHALVAVLPGDEHPDELTVRRARRLVGWPAST